MAGDALAELVAALQRLPGIGARSAQRMRVLRVMSAGQQDLVRETVRMRQRRHSRHVPARHRSGRGKGERGGGAGGHHARLRTRPQARTIIGDCGSRLVV